MVEEEYEEENNPPPEIFKPPAPMVDANVVLVALKFPKVGVDVATIPPAEFVESRELIAAPERVMDGVEMEVVKVGEVAKTTAPVPVSSESEVNNSNEVMEEVCVPYKVPEIGRVTEVPAVVKRESVLVG